MAASAAAASIRTKSTAEVGKTLPIKKKGAAKKLWVLFYSDGGYGNSLTSEKVRY